ncbi:MAG: TetR/AcrR family transcriptional regulator [Woeseiaceae bacterium]|nr:TetR/AcrR family transcriptional regulator [Woeseiaceae bacterium]
MVRSVKKIPKLRSRGRENRRKLLREAQRLMLQQPDASSVKFSDVFEAAGVSRGSAYRIYDGIEDLLQDIATDWVVNMAAYLRGSRPEIRPATWAELSNFLVRRGAEYWVATEGTLRLLPRLRNASPGSYRLALEAMGLCVGDIFERYFTMPEIPLWPEKLSFYIQLCDITFADSMRTEGRVSEQRIVEAETLMHTYLAFFLPVDLPKKRQAS